MSSQFVTESSDHINDFISRKKRGIKNFLKFFSGRKFPSCKGGPRKLTTPPRRPNNKVSGSPSQQDSPYSLAAPCTVVTRIWGSPCIQFSNVCSSRCYPVNWDKQCSTKYEDKCSLFGFFVQNGPMYSNYKNQGRTVYSVFQHLSVMEPIRTVVAPMKSYFRLNDE